MAEWQPLPWPSSLKSVRRTDFRALRSAIRPENSPAIRSALTEARFFERRCGRLAARDSAPPHPVLRRIGMRCVLHRTLSRGSGERGSPGISSARSPLMLSSGP